MGEGTQDVVRLIKVSVLDSVFEQYLLRSSSGPGALLDPENGGEGTACVHALVVPLLCDLGQVNLCL